MGLKERTILGMLWSAVERFGYTFIMFLSNLFLARLLSPDDFGLIGMIAVFISVASIIVEGGFASALIQKKEINSKDYSTAFHVNVAFAVILYIVLFFFSPTIAAFYSEWRLESLLRILGLILIINAFSVVQIAKIKRELNFKYLSIVSVISSCIGCVAGIVSAFSSLGIWSLVIQNLVLNGSKSFILFITSSWKPQFVFSLKALKEQFNFGSMVLFSNLADTLYTNSISLILGKMFSSKTLGYYTQARTLESVPNQTIMTIVGQVTFPVFARLQNEPEKLLIGIRKVARCLVWVNFPLMVLLIVVADPLFRILYTDKWAESIPLFQIACCGGLMLSPVQLNNSILLARGYSRLYFFSRLLKQIIGLVLIVLAIFTKNLIWLMILGVAFTPYLFFVISVFYTKKVMSGYGFRQQLADIFDILIYSLLCGFVTSILCFYIPLENHYFQLLMRIFLYGIMYFVLSKYLLSPIFQVYFIEIKKIIGKSNDL